MITFLPAPTMLSIADLTVVPFGNVAFDTLPSPPPQTAVQPPSTRNASVIPGSPAAAALAATCEPIPRLMSMWGAERAVPPRGEGEGEGEGEGSVAVSIRREESRSLKLMLAAVKQVV